MLAGCGGEPAPVAPPAPIDPPDLVSPEERAHRDAELGEWLQVDAQIGTCYEARVAAGVVTGVVAVRFTIQPDGHAANVVIAQAEPHDEAAEACVVRAVEAMPFTPSEVPVERTIERRFDGP